VTRQERRPGANTGTASTAGQADTTKYNAGVVGDG
jgi:hypothetical protein